MTDDQDAARGNAFIGGGALGARMREVDWSATPLGSTSAWPQSLRSALSICLGSRFPIAIYWGPELALLYNDAWSPILGEKHPWALGKPAKEVWPEIWDTIGPMFAQVMTTGEATYSEDSLLLMHRHGYTEECFFNFTFSPVRGEKGVEGIFNAVIETTYRVLAERRTRVLRDLGERLVLASSTEEVARTAADSLGKAQSDVPFCAIYLVGEDGSKAMLVASAGLEVGGPAAPSSIALSDGDTWPLGRAQQSMHALRVDDLAHRFDVKLPGGSWPEPASSALVVPIALPPATTASAFLVIGASPRRAIDEDYIEFAEKAASQLAANFASAKRREELAELDRAKTAFFSNVSHEFRTPLTLMLAPIESALSSPDRALRDEDLETSHRNALRLLKLVNSLLDFARIEAGRTDAVYEPSDLSVLTADLASTFRSAIERAGLAFVVDCSPVGEPIFVDHTMWEKIVLNLLSNAFKFTFDGTITVRLRAVAGAVELEIRDTGEGIPAAELPRLFERFHRIASTRSRSQEGSGIGLALVDELVRMHGGTIEVASEEGKGTTFRVRIPRGSAHLPAERVSAERSLPSNGIAPSAFVEEARRWSGDPKQPSRIEARTPKGGRIVFADDNADMRDYVARLLSEHWDVEVVTNGTDALAAVKRERPDLVVSDVMMPGLDGFALLTAIRADVDLRDLQVVLLSARAGEEATAQAMAAGADDYLVKPFSARDLVVRAAARLNVAKARATERRRLLRLLEQLPAIVNFMRGPDLVFEFEHPLAVKALGGRRLLGKKLLEAIPEHRGQPFHARMMRVYETGEPFQQHEAEARLMVGDEEQVTHWSSLYQPIRDESGRIEGVMTFDLDVTETVKARRQVDAAREDAEHARALLTAAQQAAQIGIFDWDARSKELYWSPELYALIGRRPNEFAATLENWDACVHPDDLAAGWAAYRTASANRTPIYQIEERVIYPNGTTRWLRMTNQLTFDDAGRVVRCVGAAVDIQELKELAEREREARFVAEEASRAKDDFLAMLGHELRNPLAPIATAVQLLKLRSKDNLAREVSVIDRQSQHIARLVDDLLDVSRIASGKVVLNKDSVEVADLVAAAIETASPAIENGKHVLVANVPKQGLVVDVDRGRMTQVLANLLANAAKYTPAGGRIVIEALRDGADVVISVEDSGVGISAELLPHVFDLFVQARQTLDRAQGGLGLGLALVKNLVAMHGGSVTAKSEGIGHGSTFSLRIPSIEGPATEGRHSESPVVAAKANEQRVLIVDDNADGAEMLAAALEAVGCRTALAHDGPEALRIAGKFVPHVALLDIGLPIMDGYELAKRLRREWLGIKLIAITGYGQESDRQRTREAGFHEHLTKPVDLDRLGELLANFGGGSDDHGL